MKLELDLEQAEGLEDIPARSEFEVWASAALAGQTDDYSLSIRVVDDEEGRQINEQYRNKTSASNVLSFPSEIPNEIIIGLGHRPLGDLVMCAPLIEQEAQVQGKRANHHWAHLTIHGVLHLLGMDHQHEQEATAMEARERSVLAGLGIADPY